MSKATISQGTIHRVPNDLRAILLVSPEVLLIWNGLTPLARNEWICYVTIFKKAETRAGHIHRLQEDLPKGKKRPCCWPGCPHHRPEAQKWFSPRKK